MRERLASYDTPPQQADVIWFHAVSVGEVEAAIPVIMRLLERRPADPILVTCTTPTGSARIRDMLGNRVSHVFLPYDLPDAIDRFLNQYTPVVGIILETEIWPNLFRACRKQGMPLVIINARLSESSARGYRKLAGLVQACMTAVTAIAAQTPEDAKRFIEIGATADKTTVMGNIKFEIQFDDDMKQRSLRLRSELFPGRMVWIAGSTHPGEEEGILDALETIRKAIPNTLLILAPRHPERADQIHSLCARRGHKVVRRSEHRACEPTDTLLLLDTLGELRTFYGTADIAFVGGSLVPIGGHNVLEPAVAEIPVLFGPHMRNFRAIAQQITDSGGALQVSNSGELAQQVVHFLSHPDEARSMSAKGRAFVEANRGAVERVSDLIESLLVQHPPSF